MRPSHGGVFQLRCLPVGELTVLGSSWFVSGLQDEEGCGCYWHSLHRRRYDHLKGTPEFGEMIVASRVQVQWRVRGYFGLEGTLGRESLIKGGYV